MSKNRGFLIWAIERAMSHVPQLDGSIRLRCEQAIEALRGDVVPMSLAEEISVQMQRAAMADAASPVKQDGLHLSCLDVVWAAVSLASGYRSATAICSDLVSMARTRAMREWEAGIMSSRGRSDTEIKHALKRRCEQDKAGKLAAAAEERLVSEMGGEAWAS
jgi:hypothetical protein